MYIEVDPQMADSTTRAAFPVVMEITKADREDGLDIDRRTAAESSMVELSAMTSFDGTAKNVIYSRAPGNFGDDYGAPDALDDYLVTDEDECNRLSGCALAVKNAEIDPFDIAMPTNNRMFDICPLCSMVIPQ